MKISEMNNEQAADALIRLSVPFGNLCEDEKIVEIIKKFQGISGQPMIQTMGRIIPELVTFAFKTHKDDLYEIVGALTNESVDKVAKMNFVKTVNILKDSYDDTLRDFFTSYKQRIKGNVEASSQG